MALSWNEIRTRAIQFAKEWEQDTREEAEAKSFWDQSFNVFGITRRRVATFEHKVPLPGQHSGYIDVLWKGVIMVEHKSRGRDLDKALTQAKDYFPGLAEEDLPRYILTSDFARFRLYDLEAGQEHAFSLQELPQRIHLFDFLLGFQKRHYAEQDPINVDAALRMGQLHDQLKAAGYEGHELELYLVRLLFCLFADDTGIFNKEIFLDLVERKTRPDGSDLGLWLAQLFEVLDRPEDKRLRTLDEDLQAFPYVNGKLFSERLGLASFDSGMRRSLLHCCGLDWGQISPAIFGSLFQSVMNPKERRSLGAHYTSEKNILKLIKPLFLDALWQEFEGVRHNRNRLLQFHRKLASLRFLDPACGCGNFLIITYRELRLLEIEILKELQKGQQVLDITQLVRVDVDQFFGIEYEEFPSQIAQVAMWLMDHQMNMRVSQEFGEYLVRLPLRKSATIVHGNALRVEWQSLLPASADGAAVVYDYILGNPPFVGKKEQNKGQKADMEMVFNGVQGAGVLDYVAAWYILAAKYIQEKKTKVAFVSTNSISQGEQVAVLWNQLYSKYQIKIHFAHQTFQWKNEAKGNAAVHVVIIGFANYDSVEKFIFEYEHVRKEPHEKKVLNINPYLIEGVDSFLHNRKAPLCPVSEIVYGSFALDDGNFTISQEEFEEIEKSSPAAIKFLKPFIGGRELLHSIKRYCLWLANASPSEIRNINEIKSRVENVRNWRLKSDRTNTKKLAATPTLFAEVRQPNSEYLAFPTLSSVNRNYIPIAFLTPDVIASNQLYVIPNASLFSFGIMASLMHMTWVKYVCGRFKSDYRYSASIIYNNYPWPETPSEKQVKAVEAAAQEVLDARAAFPGSSLADLYDPLTMPPRLVKAHQHLDRAVDLCYRPQPFPSETKRMEYLFELYDRYTAGLFVKEKKGKKKAAVVAVAEAAGNSEAAELDGQPVALSSPVCFADSPGLREGFRR